MKKRLSGNIVQIIKISLACVLSIFLAYICGLEYFITSGIITILSIQKTKRETFKLAGKRAAAYICALCIAWVCFYLIGFCVPAFCVYIFAFVMVCHIFSWTEAMAMDSVLISHFLTAGNMGSNMIINETLLFVIGTGMGVVVNMSLVKTGRKFDMLSEEVDNEIKGILERMAYRLESDERQGYDGGCFEILNDKLTKARNVAMNNWNNDIINPDSYEIRYIEMRQKQAMVLEDIYKSIIMIQNVPEQRIKVAQFIKKVVSEYRRDNPVTELLEELDNVFESMKDQKLPQTRMEFEARAVLFYILKQLKEFLQLKNTFVLMQEKTYMS